MNDSKQFDETTREKLYERVMALGQQEKIFTGTGQASVEEIEEHNIVGLYILGDDAGDEDCSWSEWCLWQPEEKSSLELFEKKMKIKKLAVLVDGRPMKKLSYQHDGLIKDSNLSPLPWVLCSPGDPRPHNA